LTGSASVPGRSVGSTLHPLAWLPNLTHWERILGSDTLTGRTDMANKDKGGKSTKKVAAKDLKEKRQAKRDKKAAADSASRVTR